MDKRIKAFITDSGELIKVGKSATDQITGKTERLPDDLFGELYRSGRCARPPYNPYELVELLGANTYHYKCIKQKALDVAGSYSIVESDIEKDTNPTLVKATKKKINEKNRNYIKNFLDSCNNILTINQIVQALVMDYETCGWFVLEVIRNRGGEIIGLNHIPAHTCRFLLDGTGIVHRRYEKERLFKFFGDTEVRIDPNTEYACNEVIFRFQYTPQCDYYGIPDYMPSVGAMLANLEIRDYNISFFENGAVPEYAVVLEGGELDEDIEEVIQSHFRDNLKGAKNSHKTLVISAPEGGKVEFQPLSVDVKDGHFRLYRTDNRDEIIHAHGMPPYRIGIAVQGSLGGNVAEEMTEIYKQSIIRPRQNMLEEVFKKIFADKGFNGGITDFKLEFDEIDTSDDKMEADIKQTKVATAKTAKEAGVFTPDQIREMAGEVPFNDMDDVEEEVKIWARTPIEYQSPTSDSEEGQDDQEGNLPSNDNQNDSEASDEDTGADYTDAYDEILNDYRNNNTNSISKSIIQKIKKSFPFDSKGVVNSVKPRGLMNILKSKIMKGKMKQIASNEDEIENHFKAKLSNMFQSMRDNLNSIISDLDFSVFNTVQKDDYTDMVSSDDFRKLYPELWQQLSNVMEPSQLAQVMYEMMHMGIEYGLAQAISEVKGLERHISFNLYDKRVSEFLDRYTFTASQKTMDRLIGNVLGAIKDGQEKGETIPEIQLRLTEVFEDMKSFETERIARTETIKSSNTGRFEAYKQGGVPKKVWIGHDDGRERTSHIALNYKIVPIDEPFSNGLMYPGDPNGDNASEVINCRCSIGAIYPENEPLYQAKYDDAHKDIE